MTKKQKNQVIFILVLLVLASILYYFFYPTMKVQMGQFPGLGDSAQQTTPKLKKVPASAVPMINGRKVVGLPSHQNKQSLKNFVPVNTPSPTWKKAVEKSIIRQAGGKVKDLEVKQLESLIWIQDNIPLNVENVTVSFRDPDGRKISFRAMVDSQSGRLIQTWDRPVFDDFGPNKDGIRLDPRYLEN
jgi:hypothetical protein